MSNLSVISLMPMDERKRFDVATRGVVKQFSVGRVNTVVRGRQTLLAVQIKASALEITFK